MSGLHDLLADAHDGDAIRMLSDEFGLTKRQTEAAVTALLPAISTGLKQTTATPEGLGNLFAMMGYQPDLPAMYDDPRVAFADNGRAAGNDVLSLLFGSPDVSRAVVDQAQRFSGVGSNILKQMLPVIAGLVISGLMRGNPASAAPQQPAPAPQTGGGLGDILGQIFGRGMSGSSGAPPSPQPIPTPRGQAAPVPVDPGAQPGPGGDMLSQILQELQKGIQEGRIKPVIIGGGPVPMPSPGGPGGSVQIPTPGRQAGPIPSGPQVPGGDVLGQILRDMLGGAAGGARVPQRPAQSPQTKDLSDLSRQLGVMDGAGQAVFGDRFDVGRDVEQAHLDKIQNVFERFFGTQRH
jgi:hypothetical protein